MRSRSFAVAIGLMAALVASAAAPPVADPMFPDGCTYDFGVVSSRMPVRHSLRVVNTTGVPLHLESLRKS